MLKTPLLRRLCNQSRGTLRLWLELFDFNMASREESPTSSVIYQSPLLMPAALVADWATSKVFNLIL